MNFQFNNFQAKKETAKVTDFIKSTLKKQGFKKVVIPVSGGVDSSLCLLLCVKALGLKNVMALKLPFTKQNMNLADLVIKKAKIPQKNVKKINIGPVVAKIASLLHGSITKKKNQLRLGNIMARIRMIIVYDLAKKHQALVVGAENKSEYLLGYYTRFGDEACDFSPLKHLYKTQVYQLAKYLEVPEKIINQSPSAGFWPGQTDEKELGFTYKQADSILYLYLEKKLSLKQIKKRGYKKAEKVISRLRKNHFKTKVPYSLD